MSLDEYFAANRANWDDRVPIHLASRSYDLEGFLAGASSLRDIDLAEVGDVRGKTLLHLQCHFGMDTLSWAREGAQATGLDFSPAAIAAARDLAQRAGIDARFVEANVYDAASALAGAQFDVVFTGIGALCWLPDIAGWARVAGSLVKPGGILYIREGHPVLWSMDESREDQALTMTYPYFETIEPLTWDEGVTYTDNDGGTAIQHRRSHEWNHGLGQIVTAIIDAGLRVEFLHEWDFCEWRALPWMVPAGESATPDGQYQSGTRWQLPERRERAPLMYSLRARRER